MNPLYIARCLLPVFAALLLNACAVAQTYSAKPITATVVDGETGQPLEGVNVVAHWRLHDKGWAYAGDLELMETVTDKDGRFHFPGWKGKAPPMVGLYRARLGNADPGFMFFKSGYKPSGAYNDLQPERLLDKNHTWERYSDWDGKVIKLEKFKGDLQAYARAASRPLGGISFQNCAWTKMPRMLMSLFKEGDRLRAQGIRENFPRYRDFNERTDFNTCGSVEKIFSDYLKK